MVLDSEDRKILEECGQGNQAWGVPAKRCSQSKSSEAGGSLKKGQRGGIGGASGNCGVSKAVVPAEAC